MIFGGAVMTSALVSLSAQIVVLRSAAACGAWRRPLPGAHRRAACADARDLFLELGGDLFGVGVVQVAHARVAAGLERRVEVRDQRFDPQALRLVAADQHAVGAVVGDQRAQAGAPSACCLGPGTAR